jgi:hypothetical protein
MLSVSAPLLTEEERRKLNMTGRYEACEAVSIAMRNDLKRLSGGLQ